MSTISDAVESQMWEERQAAFRALLKQPLLTANGPEGDALPAVRRHSAWLQKWFADNTGWSLHVERQMARLRKTPPDTTDGTRPARARPQDPPFSRRRYVLLCLALAALERADRQITLRRIAEAVSASAVSDTHIIAAGITFTLDGRDERRDIVAVVRWLISMQVVRRVEGEEEDFVSDRGDVLYQVDRTVLAHLLDVRRPPSLVEEERFDDRLDAIISEARIQSDEARRRSLRHRLMRRLLDDPVVYVAELTVEEQDYLQRSRGVLLPQLERATGLIAEVRAEGVALVDPRGDLTDLALPEEGTDGHVALLMAEYLAERARSAESADMTVPLPELSEHMKQLVEVHGRYWRKAAREPGAEQDLVESALKYLEGLRLIRRTPTGVWPLAALGRYALTPARTAEDDEA